MQAIQQVVAAGSAIKHPELFAISEDELFELEFAIFEHTVHDVDTDYAYACHLAYVSGDLEIINEFPEPSSNDDDFPGNYLVYSLLRKCPRLPGTDSETRRNAALTKFWDAEEHNFLTNQRLSTASGDALFIEAREVMVNVLGSLTGSDLRQVFDRIYPGKGGTTTLTRKNASMHVKATAIWSVTPRLSELASTFYDRLTTSEYVQTLETVPKDAKTDRCILKQPDANIAYQRSVGKLLRHRLDTRTSLRPSDQNRNRGLAQKACDEGLATVDLSSASDTISRKIVTILFDDDRLLPWLHLLNLGRVDTIWKDGVEVPLNMYSAMGNGYTWELETLIFYAIVRAAMRLGGHKINQAEIGVFGDDLIFPAVAFPCVSAALKLSGFKVNERKSFWQGDFRESCGADYWRGKAVRPHFLRAEYYSARPLLSYLFEYHNQMVRYEETQHNGSAYTQGALTFVLHAMSALNCEVEHYQQPMKVSGAEGLVHPLFAGNTTYRHGRAAFQTRALRQSSQLVITGDGAALRYWLYKNRNRPYFSSTDVGLLNHAVRYDERGVRDNLVTWLRDLLIIDPLRRAREGVPEVTEYRGRVELVNGWTVKKIWSLT